MIKYKLPVYFNLKHIDRNSSIWIPRVHFVIWSFDSWLCELLDHRIKKNEHKTIFNIYLRKWNI